VELLAATDVRTGNKLGSKASTGDQMGARCLDLMHRQRRKGLDEVFTAAAGQRAPLLLPFGHSSPAWKWRVAAVGGTGLMGDLDRGSSHRPVDDAAAAPTVGMAGWPGSRPGQSNRHEMRPVPWSKAISHWHVGSQSAPANSPREPKMGRIVCRRHSLPVPGHADRSSYVFLGKAPLCFCIPKPRSIRRTAGIGYETVWPRLHCKSADEPIFPSMQA
jgi:hypothetical protein